MLARNDIFFQKFPMSSGVRMLRVLVVLFGWWLLNPAYGSAQQTDFAQNPPPRLWPKTLTLLVQPVGSMPSDTKPDFLVIDESTGLKRFGIGAAIGGGLGFLVITALGGDEGAYFGLAYGVPFGALAGGVIYALAGG